MKNQDLDKKKVRAQKKALAYYRQVIRKVIDRSERTLKHYPDSQIALENKSDCEIALKAEKTIYERLQLDTTKLARGQLTVGDWETE